MLTHELLKNCAGLELCGDKRTLEALHEVLHDVNDRSPAIEDKEGMFLGLAYDVRKALEGQRRIIAPPKLEKEVGSRFGVEVLWPVILLQSRMLRGALAFMDHSRRHQALTYALEDVIERAIDAQFGAKAAEVKERWLAIDPFARDMDAVMDTRGALFSSWTKQLRQTHFLAMLDSMWPDYAGRYAGMSTATRARFIDPKIFDQWRGREWPDPGW